MAIHTRQSGPVTGTQTTQSHQSPSRPSTDHPATAGGPGGGVETPARRTFQTNNEAAGGTTPREGGADPVTDGDGEGPIEEPRDPETVDLSQDVFHNTGWCNSTTPIGTLLNIRTVRSHSFDEAKKQAEGFLHNEARIVGVNELSSKSFIQERKEEDLDVVLLGLLYAIVHYKHDAGENDDNRGYRYGDRNPKRSRREYNRIFMFAGLNGQFFCLIYTDESSGRTAMQACRRKIAVGRIFAVCDPQVVPRSQLRGQMTTIETPWPLVPLKSSFVPHVPLYRAIRPATANLDAYFCYHRTSLRLYGCNLKGNGDAFPPCCNGALCDRKGKYRTNGGCGCYDIESTSRVYSVVMEYRVGLDLGQGLDEEVKAQRSLRVTNLFVESLSVAAQMNQDEKMTERRALGASVRRCCEYVNSHGGFTVMGTLSFGQIDDISDQTVKTAGDIPTVKIAYLWPTDPVLPQSPEYKRLKYLPGMAAVVPASAS